MFLVLKHKGGRDMIELKSVCGEVCEALCYEAPRILFHGTAEAIDGNLRGGFYDKILWTATTPDIAQNYIPEAGCSSYMSSFSDWELDCAVRPESLKLALARMMGYEADVEVDDFRRLRSWMWSKKGASPLKGISFVNRELKQFIESLGYREKDDGFYELKTGYGPEGEMVHRADYRMPGRLYLLRPRREERLFIYDHALPEGDLMDLQYHHLHLFAKLQAKGYDGVRINDFAQSKTWGNVGHFSIGLFPAGIGKCDVEWLNAYNYDWPADVFPGQGVTPEYDAYLNGRAGSAA